MEESKFQALLTVDEVAARLKCHVHTVRRWVWSGRLRAVKVGDLVRVPEEELARLVQPIQPRRKVRRAPHGPQALLKAMDEIRGLVEPGDVEELERILEAAEKPVDWSDPLG